MALVPLALSNGTLTFLVFVALALFVVLAMLNLRKHLRGVNAPYESDLTEAGREAQKLEHPGM